MPMDTIKRISAIINRISLYAAYVAGVFAFLLIAIVLAEIIRRTFFNSSFLWTFEISSWLLVAFAFFGMGYTLQSGGHVRISLLTSRLPQLVQTWLELILSLIAAAMFAYFTIFIFEGMVSAYQMGETGTSVLEPPVYLLWAAAAVGMSIFTLQFVGIFLENLVTLKTKEIRTDE
ncbi:MAG: TRAP transporter small permease, partial [bacterium]|nr:TRAP transporter small permease [bacterium]